MASGENDVESLQQELAEAKAAVRQAEADRDERVHAAKMQLQDAKEKAKALFQTNVGRLTTQIKELEESARLKQQENDQLKGMLRNSDRMTQEAVEKATEIILRERDDARVLIETRDSELALITTQVDSARMEKAELEDRINAERREFHAKVAMLESKLRTKSLANDSTNLDYSNDTSGEKKGIEERPVGTCGDSPLSKPGSSFLEEPASADTRDMKMLKESLTTAQNRIRELEEDVSRKIASCRCDCMESAANEKSINSLDASRYSEATSLSSPEGQAGVTDVTNSLAASKTTSEALNEAQQRLEDLQGAYNSLQIELETVKAEAKDSSVTFSGKTATTKLESSSVLLDKTDCEGCRQHNVRILELERLVSAKQSEIGKVREKARAYLKDLNAEKRETETKLRDEIAKLNDKLILESAKVSSSEQELERLSNELDSCICTIGEKQKTIQSLNMTISSERNALRESRRQQGNVNEEFKQYKERARIALEEKEASLSSVEKSVESATKILRQKLHAMEIEKRDLAEQLKVGKMEMSKLLDASERASRAEAALELAQNNTDSTMHVRLNRINELELELDSTREEVERNREALVDASARYKNLVLRLEAAELALKAAEAECVRTRETSANMVNELHTRVQSLEESLRQSKEASAAAQRTAAAAAQALNWRASDSNLSSFEGDDLSMRSERQTRAIAMDEYSWAGASNSGSERRRSPRMQDHSPGIERNKLYAPTETTEDDSKDAVFSRDQQIAVLTSQIAELGILVNDVQEELQLREEQTELLKAEVRDLQGKLSAADKLSHNTPFNYMRAIIVRYIETKDPALVPVIANVLCFTEDENERLRKFGVAGSQASSENSYFGSFSFLGLAKKS